MDKKKEKYVLLFHMKFSICELSKYNNKLNITNILINKYKPPTKPIFLKFFLS